MTSITRRNMMVHHFGCTHDQIDTAARNILKIRKQREQTKKLSPSVERRQEFTECITRRVKKTLQRDKLVLYDKKNIIRAHEDASLNHLVMVK